MESVEVRVVIIEERGDVSMQVAQLLHNDSRIGVTGVWLGRSIISYMKRDKKEQGRAQKATIKIPEWLANKEGFEYD